MTRGFGRTLLALLVLSVVVCIVATSFADEGETKVSIDKVPSAVKTAIQNAVGDGKLVDIGEFTKGDTKTYEIEMVVDGKEFDVLFSAAGEVLNKRFEGVKLARGERKTTGDTRGGKFQDTFGLKNRRLGPTGRNRYFILEPGYQLVLQGKEGDQTVKLEVLVLDETKNIDSIETRVVEERESVDGKLVEISRNFFAICEETKSVFYFGEEVDIYRDGKVVAHEGAWMHGENGARAGLMMPGEPVLGAAFYQEVAPKMAMDRARIVDVSATLATPAGVFDDCLKVQEENPLDNEKEIKTHAPGIGLIQDEGLLLVKYGFLKE